LTAGADAKVVGSDMKAMGFTEMVGRGETRIAFLSRVPAALLGISEGLQGSSLNQGNFGMARRMFADTWITPTLADLASALEKLLVVPEDAELWFDTRDIPLLREDAKDAAEIQKIYAGTINTYITAGYKPDSAVLATVSQDPTLLIHTGLVSVQLQPPGTQAPPVPGAAPPNSVEPPAKPGESKPKAGEKVKPKPEKPEAPIPPKEKG
jgi:hypothetical protein